MYLDETTLICKKCKKEKPLEEFYVNKIYAKGYSPQCKECIQAQNKTRSKGLRLCFKCKTQKPRALFNNHQRACDDCFNQYATKCRSCGKLEILNKCKNGLCIQCVTEGIGVKTPKEEKEKILSKRAKKKKLTIEEIDKRAKAAGMSYGIYVSLHPEI